MKEFIYPTDIPEEIEVYEESKCEEIVRCKDCKKRYDSMECPIAFISDLLKNTKVFEYKVSDNWFCADGEQRID